jgi:type I restriction enzyme S subunit
MAPYVSLTSQRALTVVIPPIGYQRTIAHILGTLDNKIELNRCMNETLEGMGRAIFKSWFVDFDPVRAKMNGEPPEAICRCLGITPELLDLFPDRLQDSELGEIPEGWRVSSLGEHIEIYDSKRIPLSLREREKRRGPYPYYGAASVMDYVDDYIFEGLYILMGEDGSVVHDDGTPVTQYVWGKFWVNNHAHVLRAKTPMSNEHLLLLLKQTNIVPFVTGAVQPKLSQGNLKSIPHVAAPDALNAAFGTITDWFFSKKRANEEEITTLSILRDSLLSKMLSGELIV